MDEQVVLFPMSRHSSVKEPDCSAASSSADLLDTVSSLEALRCTDLQMHGVVLGLEGDYRRVQDMTLKRRLDVDAVVKGNHKKGSG